MAGRHYSSVTGNSKSRSPLLIFLLALLPLSFVFYIFSSPSSSETTTAAIRSVRNPSSGVDYSFVSSLEKFLAKSQQSLTVSDDSVVGEASVEDIRKLDDFLWKKETQRLYGEPFYPAFSPIKVYVYEMPKKFTYDLLWLFQNTYKATDNLTSNGSPVHRLIEQVSLLFQILVSQFYSYQ